MKKTGFLIFLLILAIIAIAVMGFFIYKLNNEKTTETAKATELQEKGNTNSETEIKIGTYTADEEHYDDAGINYGDCGITLAGNNLCSIYEGFGSSHLGTYSIEGNRLICNTLITRGEEGGIAYNEYNIIFEFEIINSRKLKLIKITDNSKKNFFSPGLLEEMTYSFSPHTNIKVLLDN